MAYLNRMIDMPFDGDSVKDVKFHIGTSQVTIFFHSGKSISLLAGREGESYTRGDYYDNNKRNARENKIDKILDK